MSQGDVGNCANAQDSSTHSSGGSGSVAAATANRALAHAAAAAGNASDSSERETGSNPIHSNKGVFTPKEQSTLSSSYIGCCTKCNTSFAKLLKRKVSAGLNFLLLDFTTLYNIA